MPDKEVGFQLGDLNGSSGKQFTDLIEDQNALGRDVLYVLEGSTRGRLGDSLGPIDSHCRVDRYQHILGIDGAGPVPSRIGDMGAFRICAADNLATFYSGACKQSYG